MRFLLVLIGILAFVYMAMVMAPSFQLTVPPPPTEGFGETVLSAEAEATLEWANGLALELVGRQNFWKRVALWSGSLALAATALATIWAGMRARESRRAKEEFLNRKITGIGALTALATLLNAGGDFATSARVKPLDASIETLRTALQRVPAEIAADPGSEKSILQGLEIVIEQSRV